ncbi:MAG: flagellar motor protein [Goleter apudmare HA4340-LM2]|jgi:flagellar motor protein MotB|nr:flagellar motor protein [Goleter apudmare HA4340-LM2]
MPRRSRYSASPEDLNIWSAFTDLMSNAFMILILFLLIAILIAAISKQEFQQVLQNLDKNEKNKVDLTRKVSELEKRIVILNKQLKSQKTLTDAPPIIVIKDEGAYRFASGSAEIPQQMSQYILQQIVPEIETRTKQYNINVVEIIGHTDGQPNTGARSSLDLNLEQVVSGELPLGNLKAGSNADLGLMRALAVVKVLRDIQSKAQRLQGLKFRAYSAAQLILPNGEFAPLARQDDVTRRRIEIRFTRLGEVREVR